MIGIRFKIPNEYNNFLKQILENVNTQNSVWNIKTDDIIKSDGTDITKYNNVPGTPHDAKAIAIGELEGIAPGHAGFFSTKDDMIKLGQALINGNILKKGTVYSISDTVTGFKKPESLWDIVNELYPNIEITPKEDSKKLTATEENWPIEKITDEYFNGLPKSKEGIIVTIKSLSYLPEDGCLFVDFQYSKGEQSIERTYIIEGFQKLV